MMTRRGFFALALLPLLAPFASVTLQEKRRRYSLWLAQHPRWGTAYWENGKGHYLRLLPGSQVWTPVTLKEVYRRNPELRTTFPWRGPRDWSKVRDPRAGKG